MQAEDRFGLGVSAQYAFLHHQRGTTFFTRRRTFFCRLKNELHRSMQLGFQLCEHLSHTEQYAHVGVMPTGVHHTDFLAIVGTAHCRFERYINLFSHRQGIELGTQCQHRTGLAAAQHTDYAGFGDAGLYFDSQRPQVFGDVRRCLGLAIGEFWMLVNVAAIRDHVRLDLIRQLVDTAMQSIEIVIAGSSHSRLSGQCAE